MFRIIFIASLILALMNFTIGKQQHQKYNLDQSKDARRFLRRFTEGNARKSEKIYGSEPQSFTESMKGSQPLREKREVGTNVCSSSVEPGILCDDTKRSCRDRCWARVTIENATQFYCHCDDLCTHYADCCSDFQQLCQGCNFNKRSIVTNQTLAVSDNERCDPVPVQNTERLKFRCTRVQGVVSVYLKAKCHDDFKNSALEKKCLSEREPYSNVPSYDTNKDVHYKNKYCAECNYVKTPILWRLKIECNNKYYSDNLRFGSLNITSIMSLIRQPAFGCEVQYLEPLLDSSVHTSVSPRPCVETVFECELCKDTDLEALCHSSGLNPVDDRIVYHNIYCWKCSQRFSRLPTAFHFTLSHCQLVQFLDSKSMVSFGLLSFQILMDVIGDRIDMKIVGDKQYTNIAEMELKCSVDTVQCELERCYDNFERNGDICVLDDILVNVRIGFQVLRSHTKVLSSPVEEDLRLHVFKICQPLGIVSILPYKREKHWVFSAYNYNFAFSDDAHLSERINISISKKVDDLKQKLIEILHSYNISTEYASITGFEYQIIYVPQERNSTVPLRNSTIKASTVLASTTATKGPTSAAADLGVYGLPVLIQLAISAIVAIVRN